MYYKNNKWKSKKFDYQTWINQIDDFKKEIEEIETNNNIKITINKFGNSIYFKKDDKEYRISTHHKIEKLYLNAEDLFNADHQINIVTNSRKNIIKHLIKILNTKN